MSKGSLSQYLSMVPNKNIWIKYRLVLYSNVNRTIHAVTKCLKMNDLVITIQLVYSPSVGARTIKGKYLNTLSLYKAFNNVFT